MNALELQGLHKRFGLTEVIRGTDLAVRDGERLALIGPNGAGKSTLFALVSGQLVPDAGCIHLFGQDLAGQPPHTAARAGLGRSFQVSNLFGALSVTDNLRIAAMWSQGQRLSLWTALRRHAPLQQQVVAMLDLLELGHRADTLARELSYAEQRLLEIGLTVAGGARCVLLDEPTSGMSRAETQRVIALVRRISAGRTLVMIEHDMNVVFDLADRVAVLVYGQVIALDTPEAVRAHPDVRAAYLGQHAAQQARHA
jgi:branched-chain amino acid transport system ATP-binding protein